MRFKLGRKGSAKVAGWFNSRIGVDNSTFGHTAGVLNFAFLGTLRLTLSNLPTITFENISIAQGHSGASNNWWFGGYKCFNTNDNRVHAIGKARDGMDDVYYCVMFWRGGNDVNEYKIESVEKIDPNWMRDIEGSLPLGQLSIPGTHDSGTKLAATGASRCQNFSIEAQLYHGIRFFDIRLKYDRNSLGVFHGSDYCDITFNKVLTWCKNYLSEYVNETILMSVKNEGGGDITAAFRGTMKNYSELFLDTKKIPTLQEARGKIVLLCRFHYTDNGIYLNNGWEDNKSFCIKSQTEPVQKFYIADEYNASGQKKLEGVEKNINKARTDKDTAGYYLTFNSTAFMLWTPYEYSRDMNPKLQNYLKGKLNCGKFGTIMLDYYNNHGEFGENALVELIIANNK